MKRYRSKTKAKTYASEESDQTVMRTTDIQSYPHTGWTNPPRNNAVLSAHRNGFSGAGVVLARVPLKYIDTSERTNGNEMEQ